MDMQGPVPDWRSRVEAYARLAEVLDRLAVAFGREAHGGLEVERRAAGSHAAWSQAWDRFFDDELLDRVTAWPGAGRGACASVRHMR